MLMLRSSTIVRLGYKLSCVIRLSKAAQVVYDSVLSLANIAATQAVSNFKNLSYLFGALFPVSHPIFARFKPEGFVFYRKMPPKKYLTVLIEGAHMKSQFMTNVKKSQVIRVQPPHQLT